MQKKTAQIICLFFIYIFCLPVSQASPIFGNMEKNLIFYPIDENISDLRIKTKNKIQDVYFFSRDGIKLNAWFIKPQSDKPTVIYCHGQGENISLWQNVAQFLTDNGYGIFMLDYRGHGRSEGEPFETGLYLDLEASVNYLKTYENIPQHNIVLWGRSLGGAVVADVASRDEFKGVILESTFTNIRDAAIHLTSTGVLEGKNCFWSKISTNFVKYMPFTQKFETDEKIHKIKNPLLIAHSVNDTTIPVDMAYKLAELNPKSNLFISKTGSHHESDWIKTAVLSFLENLD